MAEQGAARRQRVPSIQVCANCAGLFAVERREAQRPTSLGACAPKRSPWVTRNGRGRTGGPIARAAQGRLSTTALAPPGAPSPPFGGGKEKGNRRAPRLQTIGAAERWLFFTSPRIAGRGRIAKAIRVRGCAVPLTRLAPNRRSPPSPRKRGEGRSSRVRCFFELFL